MLGDHHGLMYDICSVLCGHALEEIYGLLMGLICCCRHDQISDWLIACQVACQQVEDHALITIMHGLLLVLVAVTMTKHQQIGQVLVC